MINRLTRLILVSLILFSSCGLVFAQQPDAALILQTSQRALKIDGFFYETAAGRTMLPPFVAPVIGNRSWTRKLRLADGRIASLRVTPRHRNFVIRLSAQPDAGIVKWGLMIDSRSDEYY